MAEVTSYSTSPLPCRDFDVATVTEDFKKTLQLDQWTGQRRTSFETLPSDFYDAGFVAYGKDHQYADTKRVAVFAGHGHIGIHSFRLTDPELPDICWGDTAAYMGGQGQGDQQSVFMSVSSCGGTFDQSQNSPNYPFGCFKQSWTGSQFRQWLGFADSPIVDPTSLSTFYNMLSADPMNTNGQVDSWIDVMESPEAGVINMPIVYTKEDDSESEGFHGETVHHQINMRSGKYMSDNPPNKQRIIMTPEYPLGAFPNACNNTGGLFPC